MDSHVCCSMHVEGNSIFFALSVTMTLMKNAQTSPLPYRIEQTRNRHSRAMISDDAIVIRLAGNLSEREANRHVEVLVKKMAKHFFYLRSKILIDPFGALMKDADQATIALANGNEYSFACIPGQHLKASRTGNAFAVTIPPHTKKRGLHRFCWKILCQVEYERIATLVASINNQSVQGGIHGLKLRVASSKWGSCSARGVISLNPALFFTSEKILHYVIIHELAHLKHKNHSQTFWSEVERWMPDYREPYKQPRNYRLPKL